MTLESDTELDLFRNGGAAGALMASIDWAATPVGPVSGWSQALRSVVGLLLRNRFPILIWWGPEYVQFYNDAYTPVPGAKHPRSMGQTCRECWHEIWHILQPLIDQPYKEGEAVTRENIMLPIVRHGFVEETYWKIAYSPVPDESVPGTGIGGVIATVAEMTEQVFAERQLRTLHQLGVRNAGAATARDACVRSAATLADNRRDVPFSLFYLLDRDRRVAALAARSGFDAAVHPAAPAEIDLADAGAAWPVGRVLQGVAPEILRDLVSGPLPAGPDAQPPDAAIALPLQSPGEAHPYGVLICGLNPQRRLDDGYRSFFELAAQQIVAAIGQARAIEAERERARALADLDREKTAFFSNVSHEFRTPLTLLLGPLEEILSAAPATLPAEQRAALEAAHRNALRLLKLVNSLLDFASLGAGRSNASYQAVDLAQLTADLASVFRSAVERAGLTLTVDCDHVREPAWVDRDLWEKIVLNLLSNAFKFTFEGGITVRLRAETGRFVLEVADTGIGIAAEQLPRLFERFHRIQGGKARTHEGTGIGLALAHDLVKLHGGEIRAESAPGKGTRFTVTIPRGSAHLPADRLLTTSTRGMTSIRRNVFAQEAQRWVADAPPVGPSPSNGRILLADDNPDMREYVGRILGARWQVETASNGREALDRIAASPPDLVLTDVMMPELDGIGLLQALRSKPETRTMPVILLSARAGGESRVEGLAEGADDYLIKPFSREELVARVAAQLRMARLRRENEAQLERRVEERTAALSAALRELETFSYTVAHDLRAPLRAMSSFSGLLRELHVPKDDVEGQDFARRLEESARRMDALVMDLLSYSFLARQDLAAQNVDLDATARQALSSLDDADRGFVEIEGTLPPVRAHPATLWRCLANLVSNAVKFVPEGRTPRVRVRASSDGDRVRIEVEDNGIGIAPEHQEQIWGVFQRLHPAEKYPGTGIGLAIVRKGVEKMGGRTGVESVPGQGSRFIIDLPAAT